MRAAGIAVDADSYADCPFESTYDDALHAACSFTTSRSAASARPCRWCIRNALFKRAYQTPAGGYIHVACDDDAETPPTRTCRRIPASPKRKGDAVIAAFEKDRRRATP